MTDLSLNIPEWDSNDIVIHPVGVDDKEGRLAVRDRIESFEKSLQDIVGSDTGDAEEINKNGLNEYFVGGAYTRSLHIPKDTAIVSKMWKQERLWIIATGEVTFTTEVGTQRVKAPYVLQAPYGTKVALYTHEDTLWFAITGAESTNSDDIEEEMLAKNYTEFTYPWDMFKNKGED